MNRWKWRFSHHTFFATAFSVLYCSIVLLLTTISGFTADASAGFDAANGLYEQGKFAEAASAYQQMIQSGTVSAAIYFNLGNASFKSGQVGRAIAAYRNAEKITPRDADVRANLQFVRGKVQNPSFSPSLGQRWIAVLTINEWAGLAAAVLWIWLALMAAVQLRPALKESLRTLLWCSGFATVLLSGCVGAAWSGNSTRTAIVIVQDAATHNGPLDEAPIGATVHDGAELSVLDTKNDWLQVRVDGGRIGWLKRDQVALASGM
ncbi:MAG TPA: tetratricopeptide repeat protein [Verrucomicrobiae bacterium]|nr:tetratricopeptide repeat protein [Verrucomicrobiae bacterium]